jgi:hypothetical protein
VLNSNVCCNAAFHTYREKKMLTIKLFKRWVCGITQSVDKDLENWARIEYKKDSAFAYYHMKEFGTAPNLGSIK